MRTRLLPLIVVVAPFLTGCDDDGRPDRHPTRVKVLFDGEPPVGAVILLDPVTGFDPAHARSKGVVRADGTVDFTTYTPGDGVPAGEYLVTAHWYKNDTPPNLLPSRYLDPAVSGLRATIAPGENEMPTIVLTR